MREFINILEGVMPMPARPPKILYHGTNIIAATAIAGKGRLLADFPVDDDDLGAVVCTTSKSRMAQMFAIEFERLNSQLPVGAVFFLNGHTVIRDIETVPYEADTAGTEYEYEFRVKGDIDLSRYCLGVRLVGRKGMLKKEEFLEEVWWNDGRRYWPTFEAFHHDLNKLLQMAAEAPNKP